MSDKNNKSKTWERSQITFWFNEKRRGDLKAIAAGLPEDATPSDALARAIELARAYQASEGMSAIERLDELDASLDIKLDGVRDCIDLQSQKIQRLEQGLRSIHELISAVSEASDPDNGIDSDSDSGAAIDFKTWLDSTVARNGGKPERSAIAVAAWRQSAWVTEKLVSLDFMVHVATIDSKAVAKSSNEPSLARLGLVDATSALGQTHSSKPIFFVCQPVENGWVLHAHAGNDDGRAGELIGKIRI